jgi:hypothetical protein
VPFSVAPFVRRLSATVIYDALCPCLSRPTRPILAQAAIVSVALNPHFKF